MVDGTRPSNPRLWRASVLIAVIVIAVGIWFFVTHNVASYHEAENQQAMENAGSPGHGNASLQ